MDVKEAAGKACPVAFELAIKNCIRKPVKGEKRRRVTISEADSQALYDFYRKNVNSDREEALRQIGYASRRAAGGGVLLSVAVFSIFLALVFALIFRNTWAPLAVLTLCALGYYLYWRRRRAAWKSSGRRSR